MNSRGIGFFRIMCTGVVLITTCSGCGVANSGTIIYARKDIMKGTKITEAVLDVQTENKDKIPSDVVSDPRTLIGKTVFHSVPQGAIVLKNTIEKFDPDEDVENAPKENLEKVTIPLTQLDYQGANSKISVVFASKEIAKGEELTTDNIEVRIMEKSKLPGTYSTHEIPKQVAEIIGDFATERLEVGSVIQFANVESTFDRLKRWDRAH